MTLSYLSILLKTFYYIMNHKEEKKRNKRELKWEANQLYGAIKCKIHPGFGYVKI